MSFSLCEGSILQGGRYTIIRTLAAGGFGIVYLCSDSHLDHKEVAIKECFVSNSMDRDNEGNVINKFDNKACQDANTVAMSVFKKETDILLQLQDLNHITPVYDYFEEHNTGYYVMRYIEGKSLKNITEEFQDEYAFPNYIDESFPQIIQAFIDIARDLRQMHEANCYHRDISMDNLIADLEERTSKINKLTLIDFGTAREIEPGAQATTIYQNQGYTSPQALDNEIGAWVDTYALCVTLHNFLFQGKKDIAPAGKRDRNDCELQNLLNPGKTTQSLYKRYPKLAEVIRKGTSLNKEEQYLNMADLISDLEKVIDGHGTDSGLAPIPSDRKWLKMALVSSTLLIVCLLTVIFLNQKPQKLKGIETAELMFQASDSTSVVEYNAAYNELVENLDEVAGADNYIISTSPDSQIIKVNVPLSIMDNQYIDEISDALCPQLLQGDKAFTSYQIFSCWEEPTHATSLDNYVTPYGKNQVTYESLGEHAVLSYKMQSSTDVSEMTYLRDMSTVKSRLDSLGCPYAFGQIHGPKMGGFVVAIPGSYCNHVLVNSLGINWLSVRGKPLEEFALNDSITIMNPGLPGGSDYASVIEYPDQTYGLRLNASVALPNLYQYLLENGQSTLYLQSGPNYSLSPEFSPTLLGYTSTDSIASDQSYVEFKHFFIGGENTITEDRKYLLDYLATLVDNTLSYDYIYSTANYYNENQQLSYEPVIQPDISFSFATRNAKDIIRIIEQQYAVDSNESVNNIDNSTQTVRSVNKEDLVYVDEEYILE